MEKPLVFSNNVTHLTRINGHRSMVCNRKITEFMRNNRRSNNAHDKLVQFFQVERERIECVHDRRIISTTNNWHQINVQEEPKKYVPNHSESNGISNRNKISRRNEQHVAVGILCH